MNSELVFRFLLLLLLAVFVLHRGYYTRKLGQSEAETIRVREKSPDQQVTNWMNVLALLSSAVYLIAPQAIAWAALPFPDRLRWVGVGVAVMGFALLQWAHVALSRNWSDRPRLLSEQQLVTTGPYRWVRHPIYTAFLLILRAPFFLSANLLVGLLWIASTALEVAARVRYEEALLAAHFGDNYRDFLAHTGRLLARSVRTSRRPSHSQMTTDSSAPATRKASQMPNDGMSTGQGRLMPRWLR